MPNKKHQIIMPATTKTRGFEIINTHEIQDIHLPQRSTMHSAGYDFECSKTTIIPSIWRTFAQLTKEKLKTIFTQESRENKRFKPTLVPTGIKSYMQPNEYLQLANRSSNPLKNKLLLANGIGIIDADYYNNPDNDGHIQFQFINFGLLDITIKKGDRIGQGIFLPFLNADTDNTPKSSRTGGFGSTDNQ